MKKVILAFICISTLKADDERVSEPWDLQRINIPGAVLEAQEKTSTSLMSQKLGLDQADTQVIMSEINVLEKQKNEIDQKIQNPTVDNDLKKLKEQSAQIDERIKAMHKKIVAAEKKLQTSHHEAEELQNPSSNLLD